MRFDRKNKENDKSKKPKMNPFTLGFCCYIGFRRVPTAYINLNV